MPVGYSGTALPKKLGIKEGVSVVVLNAPREYLALLGELPAGASFGARVTADTDIVHLFLTEREVLTAELGRLRTRIKDEAAVWVSWPKKASKVPTTVTEDVIRQVALPLGFVDIKVCAVSEVWSGLKLVIRRMRKAQRSRRI